MQIEGIIMRITPETTEYLKEINMLNTADYTVWYVNAAEGTKTDIFVLHLPYISKELFHTGWGNSKNAKVNCSLEQFKLLRLLPHELWQVTLGELNKDM